MRPAKGRGGIVAGDAHDVAEPHHEEAKQDGQCRPNRIFLFHIVLLFNFFHAYPVDIEPATVTLAATALGHEAELGTYPFAFLLYGGRIGNRIFLCSYNN